MVKAENPTGVSGPGGGRDGELFNGIKFQL
jgi:hypothetical protein